MTHRFLVGVVVSLLCSICCCCCCHGLATSGRGFGKSSTTNKNYQPDTSQATQDLLAFLKSQKADIKNVEIGTSSQRRGLFATKTFGKQGAILCKIPSDCALALADPAAQEETPSMVQSGLNFWRMYYSKQQDAWWKPYLDSLPPREQALGEDSTPNIWTEDEIDLLEFPRIVQQAKERKQEIQQALADNDDLTREDLEYATWLVSSRAFPIRLAEESAEASSSSDSTTSRTADNVLLDDRGQVISKVSSRFIPVLIPLIDMANHHSSQPNAKFTMIDPEKDEAYFCLEALRPIKAGKEITLAYGSGVDSSVELLLNYGFVDDNVNPIDKLMLKKGGDDCIASQDGWTTTLEEDEKVLSMLDNDKDATLKKILDFRIRLKKSYPSDDEST